MSDNLNDPATIGALASEYKSTDRKLTRSPKPPNKERRMQNAARTAAHMDKVVGLRGQRVLEIGCGKGDLSNELATNYDTEVVGVDVRPLDEWGDIHHPNLTLIRCDLTTDSGMFPDNSFTRIISHAVWEHIRHPFTALSECQRMQHLEGKHYIYANLYRSAIASHLYREIPFPWPQLLFPPETIAQWLGKEELGWAFWCNKLTYAQYLLYFRKLGYYITYENLVKRPIDESIYRRFEKRLGLYPRFDLETDFFEVVLEFDADSPKTPIPDPIYKLNT